MARPSHLIVRYRTANAVSLVNGPLSDLKILLWHEAQLRATAGQTRKAVELFTLAEPQLEGEGWDYYSAATIAFLKEDRTSLLAARTALAALPKPDWLDQARANSPGIPLSWPQNLDVVDGLIACFGKPYRQAYGLECRAKGKAAAPAK